VEKENIKRLCIEGKHNRRTIAGNRDIPNDEEAPRRSFLYCPKRVSNWRMTLKNSLYFPVVWNRRPRLVACGSLFEGEEEPLDAIFKLCTGCNASSKN